MKAAESDDLRFVGSNPTGLTMKVCAKCKGPYVRGKGDVSVMANIKDSKSLHPGSTPGVPARTMCAICDNVEARVDMIDGNLRQPVCLKCWEWYNEKKAEEWRSGVRRSAMGH